VRALRNAALAGPTLGCNPRLRVIRKACETAFVWKIEIREASKIFFRGPVAGGRSSGGSETSPCAEGKGRLTSAQSRRSKGRAIGRYLHALPKGEGSTSPARVFSRRRVLPHSRTRRNFQKRGEGVARKGLSPFSPHAPGQSRIALGARSRNFLRRQGREYGEQFRVPSLATYDAEAGVAHLCESVSGEMTGSVAGFPDAP
jgi:hypothetical protein